MGEYIGVALFVLFFGCQLIGVVGTRIDENRQAELREIELREAEAEHALWAKEQEEEQRQDKEVRQYESKYDWWVMSHNDYVDYYEQGAPPSAIKPFVDELAEEIEAYPLDDVPDSYRSKHSELLSIVREFSAQLE